MGMFDYVMSELSLPDGHVTKEDDYECFLQTKDLDCTLSIYKITTEGRLYRQCCTYKQVPRESDNIFFAQLPWKMVVDTTRWEDHNYDGQLNFYDGEREYFANFKDGDLEYIVVVLTPLP